MAEPVYEVVWPLGKVAYKATGIAPRLADLNGKTVGELWDWLFRGEHLFPVIEEALRERYPGIKFVSYQEFGNTHGWKEREVIAALPEMLRSKGCDAVISGVGA